MGETARPGGSALWPAEAAAGRPAEGQPPTGPRQEREGNSGGEDRLVL